MSEQQTATDTWSAPTRRARLATGLGRAGGPRAFRDRLPARAVRHRRARGASRRFAAGRSWSIYEALGGFLFLLLLAWLLSIAMEPAVAWFANRGMRRGLATGIVGRCSWWSPRSRSSPSSAACSSPSSPSSSTRLPGLHRADGHLAQLDVPPQPRRRRKILEQLQISPGTIAEIAEQPRRRHLRRASASIFGVALRRPHRAGLRVLLLRRRPAPAPRDRLLAAAALPEGLRPGLGHRGHQDRRLRGVEGRARHDVGLLPLRVLLPHQRAVLAADGHLRRRREPVHPDHRHLHRRRDPGPLRRVRGPDRRPLDHRLRHGLPADRELRLHPAREPRDDGHPPGDRAGVGVRRVRVLRPDRRDHRHPARRSGHRGHRDLRRPLRARARAAGAHEGREAGQAGRRRSPATRTWSFRPARRSPRSPTSPTRRRRHPSSDTRGLEEARARDGDGPDAPPRARDRRLRRLDRYLDAVARSRADVVDVGPLRAFVSRAPWPSTSARARARPLACRDRSPRDVRGAAAVLDDAGHAVSFEWVEQLVPSLATALRASRVHRARLPAARARRSEPLDDPRRRDARLTVRLLEPTLRDLARRPRRGRRRLRGDGHRDRTDGRPSASATRAAGRGRRCSTTSASGSATGRSVVAVRRRPVDGIVASARTSRSAPTPRSSASRPCPPTGDVGCGRRLLEAALLARRRDARLHARAALGRRRRRRPRLRAVGFTRIGTTGAAEPRPAEVTARDAGSALLRLRASRHPARTVRSRACGAGGGPAASPWRP